MHMAEGCMTANMHAEARGGHFVFLFSLPHSFKTWPVSQKLAISARLVEQRTPMMHPPLLPEHHSHRHKKPYCSLYGCDRLECSPCACTAHSLTPRTIVPSPLPYFLRQDLSLTVGLFSQALADKQPLGSSCLYTTFPYDPHWGDRGSTLLLCDKDLNLGLLVWTAST